MAVPHQKEGEVIVKKFGVDFTSSGGALTLDPEQVTDEVGVTGEFTKTHPSGWTITGVVCEDWFYWVNDFKAHHSTFGQAYGDFEETVEFESEEAFKHFMEHHPPSAWDYGDI